MTDTTDTPAADPVLAPIAAAKVLGPSKTHIMHDFESWAVKSPTPVLVLLGACKFDADNIIDRFEVRIDTSDCQRYGLQIEAGTVEWWMDDDRQPARKYINAMGAVDLYAALDGYKMWVESTPSNERGSAWSNGSNFDNAKLKAIYDLLKIEWPFSYKQEECYRTMRNRFPEVPFVRHGVAHGALDDAISQAIHLQTICSQVGIQL